MSSAFVKESEAERWQPPAAEYEYRVRFEGVPEGEEKPVVFESGDLPDVLHWVLSRPRGGFEVVDSLGQVLLRREEVL